MTPLEQILNITITNLQKLLIDHRVGKDVNAADYNDNPYLNSQFKTLYGDVAYNSDKTRRPFKGTDGASAPFYPLTNLETVELQNVRILEYIQLGFMPIIDLDQMVTESGDYGLPALFVTNATDRQRVEGGDVTLKQVQEIIPLNFRLVTKQPETYQLSQTNIVVIDKVLEGLKYVLNADDYINLSFERRGYDIPTVIRDVEFVQALNLEEFFTPYEVVDYLFRVTVREQLFRSK